LTTEAQSTDATATDAQHHAPTGSAAGDGAQVSGASRLFILWEIASVTISFLIVMWIALPLGGGNKLLGALPLSVAFVLILLSHHARGERPRDLGWRLDNFARAARLLILPMLAAAIILFAIGWVSDSFHGHKFARWQWVGWLFVWGLLQQYVLHGFINRRAQELWGRGGRSILLVAAIFALLHLPNPWLTLATFAAGAVWAAVYQRVPNLPALALSHALMSMLLVWSLPPAFIKSLRIGFKYFG